MTTDRETVLLRDLLTATKDGDWGKGQPHEGHVPYRVIRGADFPAVRAGDVSGVPLRYLAARTVERRTLQPKDVIIETAGGSKDRPTGRTLLVTERLLERFDHPVTCASFARFLRVDPAKADPRFVFWYLQSLYSAGDMAQHQVQHTGVARFQYTRFAETQHIPLPPRHSQESIAELLGAIDDKIVVNHRKATLLDFYVRTKHAEAATATQRTVRLGDLVEQGLGGVWGEDLPTSGEDILTRCLRGVDIAMLANGELPSPPVRWLSPKPFAKRAWREGEIWVEGSGSFCGRSLFIGPQLDLIFDEAVRNSNFVKRLIPTVSKAAAAWAWLSMRKAYDDGEFVRWRTGSAFPNLDIPGLLDGLVIPLPDAQVLTKMSALVDLVRDPASIRETRALAALREALLPPLVSGEIRVPDAQELVGGMS
jgi:type I restriction enzyme S subunit